MTEEIKEELVSYSKGKNLETLSGDARIVVGQTYKYLQTPVEQEVRQFIGREVNKANYGVLPSLLF